MLKELDNYDWPWAFQEANPPSVVLPDRGTAILTESFTPDDVETIIASDEGENDGPSWVMLGALKDGRFFTVVSGCDYTGWDCQASGEGTVASTLANAIWFGLGAGERERLGFPREKTLDNPV